MGTTGDIGHGTLGTHMDVCTYVSADKGNPSRLLLCLIRHAAKEIMLFESLHHQHQHHHRRSIMIPFPHVQPRPFSWQIAKPCKTLTLLKREYSLESPPLRQLPLEPATNDNFQCSGPLKSVHNALKLELCFQDSQGFGSGGSVASQALIAMRADPPVANIGSQSNTCLGKTRRPFTHKIL